MIRRQIESMGYRVCIAFDQGLWLMTAKTDAPDELHVVRSDDEHRGICELAESVGIDLRDG